MAAPSKQAVTLIHLMHIVWNAAAGIMVVWNRTAAALQKKHKAEQYFTFASSPSVVFQLNW